MAPTLLLSISKPQHHLSHEYFSLLVGSLFQLSQSFHTHTRHENITLMCSPEMFRHSKHSRNASSFKPNGNGRRKRDTGPMVVKLHSGTNMVKWQVKTLRPGEEEKIVSSSPSKDLLQSDGGCNVELKEDCSTVEIEKTCLDSVICNDNPKIGSISELVPVDLFYYAGPAFSSSSPPPSSLPITPFCKKKEYCWEEGIDPVATRNLRQLLGI